jgi:hypothetical protein
VQQQQPTKLIDIKDAAKHMNENVRICDKVYSSKAFTDMALLNLGAAYPNQLLTVVLRGDALAAVKVADGQSICVTGTIVDYHGKPEIVATKAEQVTVGKQ